MLRGNKYKNPITVFVLSLSIFFLLSLTTNNKAIAGEWEDCESESPTGGIGASIINTCSDKLCGNPKKEGPYGVFWINDDIGTTTPQTVKVDAMNDEESPTPIVAYLHGAFYTCKKNTTSLKGKNFHFIQSLVDVTSPDDFAKGHDPSNKNYQYKLANGTQFINIDQDDANKLLYRGSTNGHNYEWSSIPNNYSDSSAPAVLKLNVSVAAFSKYAATYPDKCPDGNIALSDGSGYKMTCTVGLYRCPSGHTYDEKCWANNTEVTITTKYGINSFRGQAKVKDGANGGWHDVVANTLNNNLEHSDSAEGHYNIITVPSETGSQYQSDTAGKSAIEYVVKIANKNWKEVHVNYGLRPDGDENDWTKFWWYVGNTVKASSDSNDPAKYYPPAEIFTVDKKGNPKIETDTHSNELFIKYDGMDASGNAKFKFGYRGKKAENILNSEVVDNNKVCFTLKYLVKSQKKGTDNTFETRTVCVKAVADPDGDLTSESFEGRIAVESGDSTSAKITSLSPKTGFDNWSSHNDTVTSEPDTYTFNEDTKDVFAHFRFDVKATLDGVDNAQFRYRIASCSSNGTDACYDWIENLSVSDFGGLNDGDSISGHPETQIYRAGTQHVSVKTDSRDCTATNGCIIDYRKDSTTPKKFELEKGKSYLVCYKLFVAADSASGNNPSEWNSSVACARFTSDVPPQGDLTGYTKLKFRTNRFPGCTWRLDDGSVPAPNDEDNVNIKAKSGETKTLTVECPNTTSSIEAVFTHPVSSVNGQLIYNKVNVKAYHQNSTSPFYNENLPATTPAAVNTTIKYNSNGTTTIYPGETVCEELKVGTNAKSKACMKFKQGGELTGYIDAICPDGESIRVYITEDRESVYKECNSPGEVRFIHHGGGSNVPATLHRMYHNNCIAEIDGRCPSVSASVRETVSGNIVEGNNFTMYTNTDGKYQLQEGYLICESARFGNNDENYKHGRVCLHATPDSQCPALSSYPSGWSSASKADGTSYTYSFVKNVSTGGSYTQTTRWEGNYLYKNLYNPVYAKPGDKIEFMHCYLPGAQEVRTTKYWEDITEPAPASPYSENQCSIDSSKKFDDENYKDPIGCSDIPSFTLNSGNGDSQIGNTDFVVSSTNQEKLVEANHVEGNHTDYNFENNKYEINTISIPGTHAYLGTGIYTGSSFSENTIGYITTIGMKYDGTGYNNTTTGTAGKKDIGTATNSSTVYITIGAPGGTLTQSATAYVGRIKRKEHAKNWYFYFGYDYEVCGHYSDDEPDEDKTCFPLSVDDYSNIPKSSSDTHGDQDSDTYCSDYSDDYKKECLARGTGTGDHSRVYYERDKSTSVNTFAKRVDNSEASVVIPYNYENTATVQLQEDYTIYAGEAFTLKNAKIKVGTRQNNATVGNYATIAPNITAKLYAYASSDNDSSKEFSRTSASTIDGCGHYQKPGLPCAEIDSITKDYNEFGNMNGSYEDAFKKKEYNAFDITAGYYLCVGLGMNPSKTYDTSVDTSSVYYSQPACQKVYKKPTFAVWGGSVFSNGTIASNKAEKRTIANYYDLSTGNYTATGKDRYRIFSSWVEGVIVANGKVQNTASGAATAYTFIGNSGTAYAPIAAPGGSLDRNFCHLSPLTIANSSCSSGYSGYAQIGNNTSIKQEILRRYIDKYFNLDDSHDDSTMTGSDEYFMARNELTNSNNTIPKAFGPDDNVSIQYGQTRIIASKYDINITHDITYPDTYASANQLPQLIVYTRGNINISANVQHLNGVFIADGTINTCTEYDSTDEANTACSVQLRIDGSIIANKVEFNRTFGAAIGSNSIIPAEIINYDPTLFLWSSNKSSEEVTETFSETYTRELSPRQ